MTMLLQPDVSAMGSNTPVGLSAMQAHEESVQIGSDAHVQVLAKIYPYYYNLVHGWST